MKQSFRTRLVCWWYGLWLFPANGVMVCAAAVCFVLWVVGCLSAGTALAVLIGLLAADRTHAGWVKRHRVRLTENAAMYCVPFAKHRVIAQYSAKKKASCKEAFFGVAREQKTLPDAIPPGAYRIITHETVLRRIKADERFRITQCKPLGKRDLQHIHRRMTGKRCARCKEQTVCRFHPMVKAYRYSYVVRFNRSS